MGQAIVYCSRCSTQLRDEQFEKGKAYRIDNWVCCAACAPEAIKSLPPERMQALLKMISSPPVMRKSSVAIPSVSPSRGIPSVPKSEPPPRKGNPWIPVGIVGAIVVVLLASFAMKGGNDRPVDRDPQPETNKSRTPALPAVDSAAQLALKDAQRFAREHPDDLQGQMRLFGDLGLASDKGPAGAEARKTINALRAREEEMAGRLFAALEAEIAEPLKREEFGPVLRSLDSAKTRMPGAKWTFLIDKRDGEIRADMRRLFDAQVPKAVEAKKKGDLAALQELERRIAQWGFAALKTEWDGALAAVAEPPPPPPPPRSAEAAAYQTKWEVAMGRAAARDFAGAIAEFQKAAPGLKEKGVQDEAAEDLRLLQEAEQAWQAGIAAAAAERHLVLIAADGRSASGRVLSADADRVELFVEPRKPTVFFEWSEVSIASLLRQAPALLRALDGDARTDGLPAKYGTFAAVAKEKAAKPAAEELQARTIYYDAERDFRTMASREKSIEAYRTLKQKFKETALVKRAAARIDRRLDSGREYYFVGSDLAATGTFALGKDGRLESIADSEQMSKNGAEWEYLALPSTTYRCWVLAGGCCLDAFSFHYQATGLTEINPRTKKKASADPGGELAVQIKPAIRNLKSHPPGQPKKATRWEWLEIPLLRSSMPGLRKVRILTDQQGFGVAAVVVSATRTKAPTEPEEAELAKLRAPDAAPVWALDRPGTTPRILLDDFEKEPSGWKYIGGWEFPGAKGSLTYDTTTAHEGKGSYHVVGDFSGGGSYVGTWRDLPARELQELRLWVKATNLKALMVRIVDESDQCHQRDIPLTASADWQEVVLNFTKFAGAQHWGGKNDGKWHGRAKSYGLNIPNGHFAAAPNKGDLWIDDIEGVLPDEPSDR